MWKKAKWFAAAATVAFAVLFFGPATSKAFAWDNGPHVSFYGHFPLPHGSISVYSSNGPYRYHRPYYNRFATRPFYGRSYYGRSYYRPYFRPYRSVRVFVYDPFPHWVVRRVYDPYCNY
jgi:hypothetical protein